MADGGWGSGRARAAAGGLLVAVMAAVTGVATPAGWAQATEWETLIDGSSFQDRSALQSEWNFLYPWGSDHNGSARMYASATDNNHVYQSPSGVLNLKATRITWDEGNSSADPHLPIRYHSGAIHAKDQVLVNDQFPNYEVRGEFQAPSVSGSWPAFWLTGDWSSTIVGVGSPGSWHEYRIWMTKVNDTDVDIPHPPPRPAPYLDGQWQAVHRGTHFVGQPMWIIINLQMEGSSGSPGPTADTHYLARNVYVGRTNNG